MSNRTMQYKTQDRHLGQTMQKQNVKKKKNARRN